MPINKLKGAGIKHFNDSEAFIEYSNDMGGIYKNTEECNQKNQKKTKILDLIWLYDCLYA